MDKGEQKRQEQHRKRIDDLRSRMHKKVEYYAQKPVVEPSQLYHLVKEFFLGLLEKDYEPTYEEIITELEELDHEFLFFTNHQRKAVRDLLTTLSQKHYSNEQLSEEQTNKLLGELKEVIGDLTTHTQGNIDHLLRSGLKAIANNNIEKAKKQYLEARALVEKMDESHKKQYLPELEELYSNLKR